MSGRPLPGISVVLPALNEQGNVARAVERARAAAALYADQVEVIVVDDGSRDATADEARQAGARVVSHETNRGYGAALRSGFAASTLAWIFQMDCDNQFDPRELSKLVPLSREAQVVVGRRVDRADHWRRIWAGRMWNLLCRLAFGFIVHDVDCGFKLLDRRAISRLNLGASGACISIELCVAARRAGLRIVDVPVEHHPRETGAATGLRLRVIARGLMELYGLRRKFGGRAARV
jgi:glycosyltransferase involved in cell wall biosynthesis